jgi:hypothetical protein
VSSSGSFKTLNLDFFRPTHFKPTAASVSRQLIFAWFNSSRIERGRREIATGLPDALAPYCWQ